ncbi:MAG: MYXO-CTERM sorting domain-containing protein [Phycisphaerales bacterium]
MHPVIARSIAAAAIALPAVAFATPITLGTYQLHNHPDGGERPPLYGLRLDEMINVSGGDDIFTFNFDHAGSNMRMDVTINTIHIYGTAWGGRDTGNNADYANDGYRGFYTIDFTYSYGVAAVPGDDDIYVNPGTHYNYGSITTPATTPNGGSRVINLRDGHYGNGQPDFRLGDEDNDQGHRGFHGISGWGWMFFNNGNGWTNTTYDDWLFTATLMPTPGTAALAGLGGLAAMRRRRR